MNSESRGYVTVRVFEASDPCDWELLGPDGTVIEGWHLISVGRDHSGRFSLHVTFDQFHCVDAKGQKVNVHLGGVSSQKLEKGPLPPSARTHRLPRH
ncbi:hypothetical protein ACTRXD_11050 [Nitrospira sp. T9]|uniref:hypothetical protein n=1 Tax=unclassified Nitrospira TaxID=2652172 RepID=UPI003F94EB61